MKYLFYISSFLLLLVLSCTSIHKPLEFDNTSPESSSFDLNLSPDGFPCITIKQNSIPINLCIDTGLNNSISLRKEYFQFFNTLKTNHKLVMYDIYGKKQISYFEKIPSFNLGSFRINNVLCFEEKRSFIPADINGLLGLSFLSNFNFYIDYPNKQFTLYKKGTSPDSIKTWNSFPFSTTMFGMMVKAIINGKSYNLVIDTGACYPLDSKAIPLMAKFKKLDQKMEYDLKINNTFIDSYKLVILDNINMPFDGFIGYSFFIDHSAFIDFSKKQLFFK